MAHNVDVSVNLLKARRQQSKRQKVIFARIQVIAGVVLAVYIGIVIVVMGANKALEYSNSKTEAEIQEQQLAIAKLKPIESMYNLVVNKYGVFDEAEQNRLQVYERIEELVSLLPEKTQAETIEMSLEDAGVRVSIRADSLYEIVAMLSILEEKVMANTYDLIDVSSLSRDDSGAYSLQVQFGKELEETDG